MRKCLVHQLRMLGFESFAASEEFRISCNPRVASELWSDKLDVRGYKKEEVGKPGYSFPKLGKILEGMVEDDESPDGWS